MKIDLRLEIPAWVLLAGMLVLTAVSWKTAPDLIPVHWNISGVVDGYLPKAQGLILWPALSIALYLGMLFAPRIDPKRRNYAFFTGAYGVIRLSLLAFIAALYCVTHLVMRGIRISMLTFMPVAIGILFMVMGNFLGKIRPNWLVGIRTPWTLSDPEVWTRTHRVGGWLFVGTGFITLICAFISGRAALYVLIAASFASTLAVFVYSWAIWRGKGGGNARGAEGGGK
jgi:uncharacterized membrane protein